MSNKPEALWLADLLLQHATQVSDSNGTMLYVMLTMAEVNETAAELRRLYAENEALREINESFAKRQEWWNARMFDMEQRYMALVKSVADGQALQRPNITLTTAPAAEALLRQALEALEDAEKDAADFQRINTDQTNAAITAIRQHLEGKQ